MSRRQVLSIGLTLIIVFVTSVVIFACYTPPLRMKVSRGVAYVDVQTLGEYPTDVERVRLLDSTGRVVWEVQSCGARAQIATFELHAGANPAKLRYVQWGEFDVITPGNADTFEIQTGQRYTLEVWGTRLPVTKRRMAFTVS